MRRIAEARVNFVNMVGSCLWFCCRGFVEGKQGICGNGRLWKIWTFVVGKKRSRVFFSNLKQISFTSPF